MASSVGVRRAGVTVPPGANVSLRRAASTGLVASAAAPPVARIRASRGARRAFTGEVEGMGRAAGNGKAAAYSGSAVPSTTQSRASGTWATKARRAALKCSAYRKCAPIPVRNSAS